ncbi:hypothetical protein [Streptomyces profundus]|uniref:hypothetical protein n=1 Tax=Streptomyces profundus TaxID=2867410 RepID=UPI001D16CF52|nr:hypothetical protein [Streptomyces sp. MA3_2.13]UED84815.1 hypothetical protein K4G22_11870 [Streptomyces sp. MA3_2.13]
MRRARRRAAGGRRSTRSTRWGTALAVAALTGGLAACGSEEGTGGTADAGSAGPASANGPTSAELDGVWLTGDEEVDSILAFEGDSVHFTENQTSEGDNCEGTVANGVITLESCTQRGEEEWADRSAEVAITGEQLDVVWESGRQENYVSMFHENFED